MSLRKLLTQNLRKLTPQALIIVKDDHYYTIQKVIYAPELLNLGIVLLGYYADPVKVAKLSRLGDCLSVAHYLQAPRALKKYGRNFMSNTNFQALPAKLQKHLTGEIQDCTMSLTRDLGIKRPTVKCKTLSKVMASQPAPYVYLYRNQTWQVLRVDGHNESRPVDLRNKISQLLSKKA